MLKTITLINICLFIIYLACGLSSCTTGIKASKLDAYFTLDPFGSLPQPTPTPNKIVETTEVK